MPSDKKKITEFEPVNGVGIDLEIIGKDGNLADLLYILNYKYIGESPDTPAPVVLNTPVGEDTKYTRFWEMTGGYSMEEEPYSRHYPYPHMLALTHSIMGNEITWPIAILLCYHERNTPLHRRTTITHRTILFHPDPNQDSPRLL